MAVQHHPARRDVRAVAANERAQQEQKRKPRRFVGGKPHSTIMPRFRVGKQTVARGQFSRFPNQVKPGGIARVLISQPEDEKLKEAMPF
jgi:hypothetical protein